MGYRQRDTAFGVERRAATSQGQRIGTVTTMSDSTETWTDAAGAGSFAQEREDYAPNCARSKHAVAKPASHHIGPMVPSSRDVATRLVRNL